MSARGTFTLDTSVAVSGLSCFFGCHSCPLASPLAHVFCPPWDSVDVGRDRLRRPPGAECGVSAALAPLWAQGSVAGEGGPAVTQLTLSPGRALDLGYLTQDMIDDYEPGLMFTIPRLAIVW